MDPRPPGDREKTSNRAFLEALAHPIRAAIILMLEHGPATAAQIAEEIGAPPRTVRHHLGFLRTGGFIAVVEREARRNIYEHAYVSTTFGFVDDETYDSLTSAERRNLINHYLQSIARGLSRFVAAGGDYDEHSPATARVRLTVDEAGWDRLRTIADSAIEQVVHIREEAAERLQKSGEPGIVVEFDVIALALGEPDTQTG